MDPHPINQPISGIQIDSVPGCGPDGDGNAYVVGDSVTRIEACEKPGLHGVIPYVRVWAGERCIAEFCQHNIVGVYFAPALATTEFAEVFNPDMDAAPHDKTVMGQRADGTEVAMLWWHSWPGFRESFSGGGVGEPVEAVAWRPLTEAEAECFDDILF